MTIIVHHLNNSRSQRILWMLEEMGLPYEIRRYERDPKTMRAPASLRRIHPLGKSPIVEHGGHTLVETGAIVEYLLELGEGELAPPPNREAVLKHRMFLHYAEGSMMPPLLALLIIGKLGILGKPARRPVQSMLGDHLDWLESELDGRDYFIGDTLTAADIMMSFPLEAARARAGLDPSRPNLTAWLERIHARPAYQRALAAGGPYAYA